MNYARTLIALVQSLWNPWKLYTARHWIDCEIERTGGRKGRRHG